MYICRPFGTLNIQTIEFRKLPSFTSSAVIKYFGIKQLWRDRNLFHFHLRGSLWRSQGRCFESLVTLHAWSRTDRKECMPAHWWLVLGSIHFLHSYTIQEPVLREWCHLQWAGPFQVNELNRNRWQQANPKETIPHWDFSQVTLSCVKLAIFSRANVT